jgi:cytochrome c6
MQCRCVCAADPAGWRLAGIWRIDVKLSTKLVLCGVAFALAAMTTGRVRAQGAGEKIYKTKCASCHGGDGAGSTAAGKATKARDFCSAEVKAESDEDWTAIVVKGKNKMPGYDKKLTDAEIKDVLAYVRGLCKK